MPPGVLNAFQAVLPRLHCAAQAHRACEWGSRSQLRATRFTRRLRQATQRLGARFSSPAADTQDVQQLAGARSLLRLAARALRLVV